MPFSIFFQAKTLFLFVEIGSKKNDGKVTFSSFSFVGLKCLERLSFFFCLDFCSRSRSGLIITAAQMKS